MCGFVPFWWIFPLVCFGMMILLAFVFTRRGWQGRCSPFSHRRGNRERIQKLEEEFHSLKDQLVEQSSMK